MLDPMLQVKRSAIDGLRRIIDERATRMPPWWAWTAYLALAITVERIQNA